MTEEIYPITESKTESTLIPFQNFEQYLINLGLPSQGIIATEHERQVMSQNLPLTLQQLSAGIKRDATYLSKFVASSAIGLYDAALNYLWNEVVLSLRNRVYY